MDAARRTADSFGAVAPEGIMARGMSSEPTPEPRRARLLVVEDEAALRRIAQYRLEEAGYAVDLAANAEEGLERFAAAPPDLVITDLRMPGLGGEALAEEVLRRSPETPVVVMTGHGSVQSAVAALRRGVSDYVTKPVSWDEMLLVVQRELERRALRRDNQSLRATLGARFREIVGESPAMRAVFDSMARLLEVDTTVLIQGETGTGKELVAHALHAHGRRAGGPFVAVNCGAIPHDLLESELFGHERGAFTGAERTHRGYFEQAHGGTLFLDEIAELPPALQSALLRVLAERRIRRVGGESLIPVDVRLVAATHRDLESAVEEGDFRKDLYYRLAVVPLRLPPLRSRGEDVVLLAEAAAARHAGRPVRLSNGAARMLRAHHWPGNVRELDNLMERVVVLRAPGDLLLPEHLESELEVAPPDPPVPDEFPPGGIDLGVVERTWIERALRHTGGNRTHAARLLGITRQTLLYRLEKHGIDVPPGSAEG